MLRIPCGSYGVDGRIVPRGLSGVRVKEGLFLRAMQQLCQQVVAPWRSLDTRDLRVEEALVLFGQALL